jgi:hypothetical protein
MNPDYHNPYTEQFNIGYSWSIDSANVFEVDYVHVLGLRESKGININPKNPNISGGPRILTPAFTAAGVPVLGSVSDNFSIGRSRYDGLNFSYRRRLTHRFSMNASYVLSRAVSYAGVAAGFGNAPTDLYNWFPAHDFGPGPNDERHRGVISGLVQLPWGFRFAPIMQIASARPYSATQGIDYFGYGATNGYAVLLKSDPTNFKGTLSYTAAQIRSCLADGSCYESSYDSLRGQNFFQFDTRISRVFRFKDRYNLEFMFQAFDLTNRANFGGNFQGSIRSSAFEQPKGFITPSSVIIPHSFSGEAGFRFSF